MTSFHPYLFLPGTCREAFTRYQEVFGGDLEVLTSADMPPEERMPGASSDAVMHAALVIGDGLLMGSDDPEATDARPTAGISVNVELESVEATRAAFGALAQGGQVVAPLDAVSFSPAFGMLVDRFGVSWLLTTAAEPAG